MDRVDGLKAVGIFLLSLGLALGMGLGFSVLSQAPSCDYPVVLRKERVDGGLRTTVTSVEGEFAVVEVGYLVIELTDAVAPVVEEGNLTEALDRTDGVVYLPGDPEAGVLQEGDALEMDAVEADVGLLLVTMEGAPLGWTEGCEA